MTFRPIPNPYIVGNPVEDQRMFFGREDDFSYIRTKVTGRDQGGMIVLCGTRRSGKTSILFQILQGRLGSGFVPVLMDLQSVDVRDDSAFVARLVGLIREAVGDRVPAGAFNPASDDFGDVAYAFRFFCRQVQDALGSTSLVVMFDEYELFETNIDEGRLSTRLLDLLGETIRGDSGFFFLFTGSDKLESRNPAYWSGSLGRSLHRRISFLSRPDALRLISEPVAGHVEFDHGVAERILSLGGGQPFYTQVLCQTLVDNLNEKEKNRATDGDVADVIQEIVDNPLPHMIFTWGDLSDAEKVALAALGEINREDHEPRRAEDILAFLKEEKTGITLAEDTLNEALERLFQNDLLLKEEDGDRFSFKMELWRYWVVRMHSIWQALDEIMAEGRKPGPGIIRLARRRIQRIGLALAGVIIVGIPFVLQTLKPAEIVLEPEVPDSTFVNIVTDPPGARVFVDNYELGVAPLDSARVEVGRSGLRYELEGFHSLTDSADFLVDTLMSLSAVLAELQGSLRVESQPPGASIRFEGEDTGHVTPHEWTGLSVNENYELELRMSGYLPARYQNLQLFPDSLVVVGHTFSKITHPLTLATDPQGAEIILDGRPLGPSPKTLARVTEGAHRLVCRLEGYHEIDRTFEVPVPGNRMDVALEALPPGHLILKALPYADMFIGGEQVQTAKMFHRTILPVGEYEVELIHPHFGSFRRSIRIDSGDTTIVDHDFRRSGP